MRYGRSVEKGFLPVYSVDTEEEAEMLLRTACDTNVAGEYVARELVEEQTLENLEAFGARLQSVHERIKEHAARAENEDVDFGELQEKIVCPACGNDGTKPELWEANGVSAFRITERVVRTWPIERVDPREAGFVLVCEGGDDEINWETSTDTAIECGACYHEFPVPPPYEVEWE